PRAGAGRRGLPRRGRAHATRAGGDGELGGRGAGGAGGGRTLRAGDVAGAAHARRGVPGAHRAPRTHGIGRGGEAMSTAEPRVARSGGDLHRVFAQAPPQRRASAMSASITLGWRALLKIKHVPFQLFDVTAFPLMMTLMFTFLFGGALAGSPREYIQYLLPCILVQAVVFITVYTGVVLNGVIYKVLIYRFR